MTFRFEFVGARHCLGDSDSMHQLPHVRIFGRLTEGAVKMGDSVMIPTHHGLLRGTVVQFWDYLDDWLGMPFHEDVDSQTMPDPFCLIIYGLPEQAALICPGTAHGLGDS